MIIKPKFRGFICTTAHPGGCEKNVIEQIDYVKNKGVIDGPKKVLVIGASTGYGLASRITSTFASGASTIGVVFEKSALKNRTATAGWYNTASFERLAKQHGYYAKSVNGDAFSNETKEKTIELIKRDLGKVDLVIYSVASPKRIDPVTGETFHSVLKPIGESYKNKTVDFHNYHVSDVEIEPAMDEEINQTIAVMGGYDWKLWIDLLIESDALEEGAMTIAYSYIGPEITYPIYRNGTIGKAKEHLEATAKLLNNNLESINGKALVSVNKALVTQSSSAIPVVPLYISLLSKIMKEKGLDEGCIEQIYRLFSNISNDNDLKLDDKGRIRLDDREMRSDIQIEILDIWKKVTTENIRELSDIERYRKEFFKLFGFGHEDIDYEIEVDQNVDILDIN